MISFKYLIKQFVQRPNVTVSKTSRFTATRIYNLNGILKLISCRFCRPKNESIKNVVAGETFIENSRYSLNSIYINNDPHLKEHENSPFETSSNETYIYYFFFFFVRISKFVYKICARKTDRLKKKKHFGRIFVLDIWLLIMTITMTSLVIWIIL